MGGRTSGFASRFTSVLSGTLALALLVASMTTALAEPGATVGLFALKLARALGFEAHSAAEARDLLSAAGVTFAGRLADPLTEGEAVRVLGDLGLETAPSTNPDRLLSSSVANHLAGFAARVVLEQGSVPTAQGSLPVTCQSLDRSACFQCCIASLGRYASVPQRMIDLCNNSCTMLGAPPASPTSP